MTGPVAEDEVGEGDGGDDTRGRHVLARSGGEVEIPEGRGSADRGGLGADAEDVDVATFADETGEE